MDGINKRVVNVSCGFALLLAAVTLPLQAAEPAAPGAAVVSMGFDAKQGMYFTPKELTVAVGTTVTFNNSDGSNHSVVFKDGQKSGRMKHHTTWTRTFTAPGSYPYECAIHGAAMSGVIIVK